jgi:predicted RNA-binding protein with PIN domain
VPVWPFTYTLRVLIIDAYNVLHAARKVHEGLSGLTVVGLARMVMGSRWGGANAVLVCDGSGGRSAVPDELVHPEAPVRVVFAGPGKDADALIERMVIDAERGGRGAGGLVVVSSDKGVQASAVGPVGPKARRMTSERFLRELLADAARAGVGGGERGAALDDDEVRRWVERFGGAGDSPRPPPAEVERVKRDSDDLLRGIDPDELDMKKWLGEG